MKSLTEYLTQYAAYHLDKRNVATHFVGIPMIVLAVSVLLSRPSWELGGLPLSLATLVSALAALFYLRLDLRLGLVMTAQLLLFLWAALWFAALPTAAWLAWGVGLFVVGWIIQFIGHYYEGRKPAFADDVVGLLIGPLFLTAEVAFALNLRQAEHIEIQRRLSEGAYGARRMAPA